MKYIHEPPAEVEPTGEDKVVVRCLDTVMQGDEELGKFTADLQTVRDSIEDAYSVEDPQGELYMYSKFSRNVCAKVMERMDFLDFDIIPLPEIKDKKKEEARRVAYIKNAVAKGEDPQKANDDYLIEMDKMRQEKFASATFRKAYLKAGIIEILKRAKWYSAFQGKGGIFERIVHYGNKFARVVKGDEFPIKIETYDPDCVYVKRDVRAIRNDPDGKNARQLAIVKRVDYDDYVEFVAQDEKQARVLPGVFSSTENKLKKKNTDETPDRETEVAEYFDLLTKTQATVVGGAKTKVKELSGDKYPHKKNGVCIIPVAHFRGLPSLDSFFDWGVAHYTFQMNNIKQIIENKTITGVIQEINPLWYIQGTAGGRTDFQRLVYEAEEARANGDSAIIYDEPDATGGFATGGGVYPLSGRTVSNIGDIIENLIQQNTIDFGVSMKEVETAPEKTATALTIEQEAANLLLSIISKRNAPETKFLLELVIDAAKLFISEDDRTRVDTSTVEAETPEQQELLDNLTIGKIISELKKTEVAFKIDVMGLTVKTPAVELAMLNSLLQLSVGRPAQDKVLKDIFDRYGYAVGKNDLSMMPEQKQNNSVPKEV